MFKTHTGSNGGQERGLRNGSGPHLEPLGHVVGADLVVLVRHVAALQLTRLVQFEDALPPVHPLGLPLVRVLLFLVPLLVRVRIEVGKVKVATEDLLGFL